MHLTQKIFTLKWLLFPHFFVGKTASDLPHRPHLIRGRDLNWPDVIWSKIQNYRNFHPHSNQKYPRHPGKHSGKIPPR